jgi:putative SOS response-associated peptidase YedK
MLTSSQHLCASPTSYTLNEQGEREVVSMRWGFAGKGDKNPSRPKHMHARSETIDRLPAILQPDDWATL